MSFFIAKAEASELNPKGLSLQLSPTATPTASQRGLTSYVVASSSLIVLAIGGFFIVMNVRRKQQVVSSSLRSIVPQPVPIEQTTNQQSVNASSTLHSYKTEWNTPVNPQAAGNIITPINTSSSINTDHQVISDQSSSNPSSERTNE